MYEIFIFLCLPKLVEKKLLIRDQAKFVDLAQFLPTTLEVFQLNATQIQELSQEEKLRLLLAVTKSIAG